MGYSDKLVSPLCMDNQVSQQYMGRVGSQQYMGRVGSQQYMDNQVNQLSSVNILLSLQSSQPPNLLLPSKECNESEVVTPYIFNRRDSHIIFPAKSLSTACVYRHEVPSFL